MSGLGPMRRCAGLLLVLMMAMPALEARAEASLKIGYVNPGRVSDEAPQADAAREQLQEEFAPRDEEILSMQDSLRVLEDRLAERRLSLGQDEQEELQQQIVVQRRQIQRQQEAFREDFNMRRNEALGDLQRRILRVVAQFAEEQGFDLVVSDGVVYASDPVNITDRIIQRLQRQHEREQSDD